MKFHTIEIVIAISQEPLENFHFKLNDSMYHHRKTICLDFGARRSRVTEVNL